MSTGFILKFKLSKRFTDQYRKLRPSFGYNGLGEFSYRRTYSRIKKEIKEEWTDTVKRVVEGTYQMQLDHFVVNKKIKQYDLKKANKSSEKMFDLIWNMKFLPPGRGLWAMGTDIINKRKLYAALNNCAFVSTHQIDQEPRRPFEFAMDALMLGVGVGFDTTGSKLDLKVQNPYGMNYKPQWHQLEDTRESWVESTALLIESYLKPGIPAYRFDYTKVRPAGMPLKTFGGFSAGPECISDLHVRIRGVLNRKIGQKIDSKLIVDLMNLIGRCVIAGNIRRSSEIALAPADDKEFIYLKDYKLHPDRAEWGWCSNNSILADNNTNYRLIASEIKKKGEPGVFWLDNARKYSRMVDPPNYKDRRVMGLNPCGEQSLESFELCNLVEIFLNRVQNKTEFLEIIKYAYMYAKTVTLGIPEWKETEEVMSRNRRIGLSLSSISEFYEREGEETTIEWFESGYNEIQKWDQIYSKWFNIPKSIKTTTVKPSGTISLLAGSTPGIHYAPGPKYHIRRCRVAKEDSILEPIIEAGYHIERELKNPNMSVIEFPVKLKDHIKAQDDIKIEHQFHMAALAQKYWSDNQVSCTVSFDPKTEDHKIEYLLKRYKRKLKSISLLPRLNKGAYKQMPYEGISEKEYEDKVNKLKKIDWSKDQKDAEVERYCTSEGCSIP